MEKKLNDLILVATDFSENSEFAIEHGVGIAEKFGYKLEILHVVTKKNKDPRESLEAQLQEYKMKYGAGKNIEIITSLVDGNPFSDLGKITQDKGANYLIIGTRGKTGVEYIIGSYSEKIIASSPVPVMTVQKRHFDIGYKNIIIPIDQTEETRQKFKWALEFAKRWDSTLHIFAKKCSDEFYIRKVNNGVFQLKSFLEKQKIPFTIKASEDKKTNFTKQIIEHGVSLKADLIIMMTDVESMIPSFLTGSFLSTAPEEELIMNAAQIPIISVNPVDYNVIIGGL